MSTEHRSPDEILQSSINQLKQSERGRQALFDFVKLIQNGGYGLDMENTKALTNLSRAMHQGKGQSIVTLALS